jgi:lysophospholipase L1-like esterase
MKTWLKLFTVCLLMIALTVQVQAVSGELFVLSSTNEDTHGGVFFFGESTTAHLSRTGGVLDTDEGRGKVLRDESGTRYLDMRILSSPVFYEGEKLSFVDAIERAQPRVLVLSFGLNGITRWSRAPDAFLRNYRALIEGIIEHSHHTKIVLQSVYPVGKNNCFSLPKEELNRQIESLNTQISALSKEYENVAYVNTSALLADASGALLSNYDIGDGIHLTDEAYRIILTFLCQSISKKEP